jgi:hypothetical protein
LGLSVFLISCVTKAGVLQLWGFPKVKVCDQGLEYRCVVGIVGSDALSKHLFKLSFCNSRLLMVPSHQHSCAFALLLGFTSER